MPAHEHVGRHRLEHHDPHLPVDPDLAPDDPGEPSLLHRPTPHIHRSRKPEVLALIAAGGFIGALGRYELGLAWKTPPGGVPWVTFTINTSGAFLLGLILTTLLDLPTPSRYLRPFLCVGVLGAWTTMSTFAVETDLLAKDRHLGAGASYLAITVIAGLSVAWLGILIGRSLAGRVSWRSP
jgi:CrcB protein